MQGTIDWNRLRSWVFQWSITTRWRPVRPNEFKKSACKDATWEAISLERLTTEVPMYQVLLLMLTGTKPIEIQNLMFILILANTSKHAMGYSEDMMTVTTMRHASLDESRFPLSWKPIDLNLNMEETKTSPLFKMRENDQWQNKHEWVGHQLWL